MLVLSVPPNSKCVCQALLSSDMDDPAVMHAIWERAREVIMPMTDNRLKEFNQVPYTYIN